MRKSDIAEALEPLSDEEKAKLKSYTQPRDNGIDVDSLSKDLEIIPKNISRAKLAETLDPFLLRLGDALEFNVGAAFLRQELKNRFGLNSGEIQEYTAALKRKQAELKKAKKNQGQVIKPPDSNVTQCGNVREGDSCYLRVKVNSEG